MDKFISQLTHDNDVFDKQWPDTYSVVNQQIPSHISKSVLNALIDYAFEEPSETPACYSKYVLITMIIDHINGNANSIEVNDLMKMFVHILDTTRTDEWYLNFLKMFYEKFEIGTKLRQIPLKTNIIDKILASLKKRTFTFTDSQLSEKWETFLTTIMFANRNDADNILNNELIIKNMQKEFQEFHNHGTSQSHLSSTWCELTNVLYDSFPDIFGNKNVKLLDILLDKDFHIEDITRDHIAKLNDLFIDNDDVLKEQYPQILALVERLILANQYENANFLFSRAIIAKLKSLNIEMIFNMLVRVCPLVEQQDSFNSQILSIFLREIEYMPLKKELSSIAFDLLLAILKMKTFYAPPHALELLERSDFYSWKDSIDKLVELIKICISYETIISDKAFDGLESLSTIIDIIREKSQVYPIISKTLHPIIIEAIFRWSKPSDHWSKHVYFMGQSMLNLIDLQQIDENAFLIFINLLIDGIICDDETISTKMRFFLNDTAKILGEVLSNVKVISIDIHSKLAELLLLALNYPLYDDNKAMTVTYVVLCIVALRVAPKIFNDNEATVYESFLKRLYYCAKDEYDDLYQIWIGFWSIIGSKLPDIMANHLDFLLEYTFDRKDQTLIGLLLSLCLHNPEVFRKHFNSIVDNIVNDQGNYIFSLSGLFPTMTKRYPEIVSSKQIDQIFTLLKTTPYNDSFSFILLTFVHVANYHPYLFDNHYEELMDMAIKRQNTLAFEAFKIYIISTMILENNDKINQHLDKLIDILKTKALTDEFRNSIFYTCLLIGIKSKQLLIDRRDEFLMLKSSLILNFLNNTTTSNLDQAIIQKAQVDIELIELSIDKTLINKRDENQNFIHFPSWIYQITKLLNRRSDNDWHLLAKHLGFTQSEIKNWSMQKDPCVALMNEWFMTHKIDDAIDGLVKALRDINRHDTEQIIRQSLMVTGKIIPDEVSFNFKRLSPIFISYHSNKKIVVDQLKDHLEDFGFSCEMYDENSQISNDIYAAKVILFCIDESYCQSDVFSNEFSFICDIKKPFLILHLETKSWPPEGKIKLKLNDLLHIEFDNWSENQFLELIGQIRYYVTPDLDKINRKYHHWFLPRLDNLIFLKSLNDDSLSLNHVPLCISQPNIVVTYHWDYQKQVILLYKQLTQLGYKTWLDIFQMGDGETLLEKCNVAIRQSSCLIVCLTPKYVKSLNCQRELTLANKLNKRILCLLLEETSPLPLISSMLSEFSGRSYIDFRNTNDQWTGKSFDILLAQLKQILPNVQTDKPRHLIDMQRPFSASQNADQRSKRRLSAPIIPQSRACSIM